jgi:hypothetical protein
MSIISAMKDKSRGRSKRFVHHKRYEGQKSRQKQEIGVGLVVEVHLQN